MRDFDPDNIKIVDINEVRLNDWNPKLENTPEYKQIVESIQVNGFKQPIIVRQVEGLTGYEVCDGCQRLTACKELGFDKIYIYNLGEISESEAKSITIWMEQRVNFDELSLAPLIVELNNLEMNIPYTEEQVQDFTNMLNFDFVGDGKVSLSVKCTEDQYDHIKEMLNVYMYHTELEEDKALLEMAINGGKRYE